ncbi:hypothetical protein F5I97DRAFT_822671 [Phlebopus sp. FC_14]|nr:hypothetical protein F5I97DRAFT_822671 [Phlebopus sp. FC_14]
MVELLRSPGKRSFRFCIPNQWLRRSKQSEADVLNTSAQFPDDEGENTAKIKKSEPSTVTPSTPRPGSPEWRSSISQSRLTNFISGWSQPAPAMTSTVVATSASQRKSVSEPLLVQQHTGGSFSSAMAIAEDHESELSEVDAADFERCLDQLGIKGDARENMYNLPSTKKRQLIEQANSLRAPAKASLISTVPGTADSGILKRFSAFSTWGSTGAFLSEAHEAANQTGSRRASIMSDNSDEPLHVLQPQNTGSVFNRLWSVLGGESSTDLEDVSSCQGIRGHAAKDTKDRSETH